MPPQDVIREVSQPVGVVMPPVQEALPGVPGAKEMALTPAGVDPMLAMMERLASNKDVDVEKLRALIDMQKDIMAVNAKAAFDAAFAKMQPRIPTITETASTDKATYAPLEDIVEQVRPILSEFGFSINHRTEFLPDGKMKIIGRLKHEQGHSEESEFVCAADQTGSKNAIQALGSSNHYGRRYTTKDLLGIVTKGADDDGKKAGIGTRPEPPAKFEPWWTDLHLVGGVFFQPRRSTCGIAHSAWTLREFSEYLSTLAKNERGGWTKSEADELENDMHDVIACMLAHVDKIKAEAT